MASNCVIGVCLAVLCATPVFGEGGTTTSTIKLAKYMEEKTSGLRQPEAASQVKVTEKYNLYEIDGSSTDELRAQMKRNGTTWNDGKIYAALTTWDIHYNYDIKSSNGRYYLDSIKTDVDIVFHLPRLVPQKASEQLATSWNDYLTHLKAHEYGHRDIAVGVGQEIYQALASLGSASSRKELDDLANKIIRAKFQHLKQAQVDYDLETHHGKKQGAVLMDPQVASVSKAAHKTQIALIPLTNGQAQHANVTVPNRQVQLGDVPVPNGQVQHAPSRQAQNTSVPAI